MALKKILTYITIRCQKIQESILQKNENNCYVFMFHDVVKDKREMYEPQFCITAESFEFFCKKIKEYKFNMETTLLITFDDGFQGLYENAYPILNEMSLDFTVFVTCNFLNQKGYISAEQLKELSQNSLCTIGSHTNSHPHLSGLTKKEAFFEIHHSKVVLQNIINKPVESFAYPYGDIFSVKRRERKLVREAGYEYAFGTLCAGFNKELHGQYYIPRINVNEDNWEKVIKDCIEGKL